MQAAAKRLEGDGGRTEAVWGVTVPERRGGGGGGGGNAPFERRPGGGGTTRDALEGKGPQRRHQKQSNRQLEEVPKRIGAVTVGYNCH